MSGSPQINFNGNCGRSKATLAIPKNAIPSPVVCQLPCVAEYSTLIAKFRNQVIRDVLTTLSTSCVTLTPPLSELLPAGAKVVISDTTTFDQSLAASVNFQIPALSVISVNVSLRDVRFEIVGFSSVIVGMSGVAVVAVTYEGTDSLIHDQTTEIPFFFTETVSGDFPSNVTVEGSLSVNNQLVVNDVDPSFLTVTGVSVNLFFADNIRILMPV